MTFQQQLNNHGTRKRPLGPLSAKDIDRCYAYLRLWVRNIPLALFVVSSIDYKLAIYDKKNGPIWFLSILWQDALVALFLFWLASLPITMLLSLLTAALASVEIVSHRVKKIEVPWKLTYKLIQEWEAYWGLVQLELNSTNAEQPGGLSRIIMVWQRQLVLSAVLTILLPRFLRVIHDRSPHHAIGNPSMVNNYSHLASRNEPARSNKKPLSQYFAMIGFLYILVVSLFRPTHESYSVLSRTIVHQVGREIYLGYRDEKELQQFYIQEETVRKVDVLPSLSSNFKPNVVVILLESTRKDTMPFNYSSPWAKQHTFKDCPPVTPFYDKWTKDNDTVYIPLLQSVSSYTHKSLFSIFCSQHGLPREGTQEHAKPNVHECLPRILQAYGYETKLFKGMTRDFDHQTPLATRLGFSSIYGFEDILDEQNGKAEASAFRKKYGKGRWLSIEDKPLLKPIMEWVEEQHSQENPFLLSYMTSATHTPPITPQNNWTKKRFAVSPRINDHLNAISYTDDFVKLFVEGLGKRGLLNNTLLVMMGDHGCDLGEYGKTGNVFRVHQQVAFEVGMTYHSQHNELRRRLNIMRPNVYGNWSSLDVAPTILDLLGIPISTPFDGRHTAKHAESQQNSTKNSTLYSVDGRSILRGPSGSRLSLSLINTGQGLILKDRELTLVNFGPWWWFYDLHADPTQNSPIQMPNWQQKKIKGKVAMNNETIAKYEDWAAKAKNMVEEVRMELEEQFTTGVRNSTGVIFKLLTLETLHRPT